MIRIARLDENKKVLEILELENPRESLHPDTLKKFVSATAETEVGDYYEDQQFVKKDPEDVESEETKARREIEIKESEAKNILQNFDLEKIKDENTREVISNILQYLNIF